MSLLGTDCRDCILYDPFGGYCKLHRKKYLLWDPCEDFIARPERKRQPGEVTLGELRELAWKHEKPWYQVLDNRKKIVR